ncbi:fibrinogen-like protein 1 [Ambystoma mexicanum]|uniref:fibrinogen-like protein 1 n=1 Tax=Ambystoma mexicanum TaxID=8296 RepID=UPI0037E90421
MAVPMPFLFLVLGLLSCCSSAPRLSDHEICKMDNIKLQQRLDALQDAFLLGNLQLRDLMGNNYHRIKSKIFSFNVTTRSKLPQAHFPTTSGNLIVYDRDCSTVFESRRTTSGYFRIKPWPEKEPFLVYCDMSDGGGWTVLQRRSNGKVNFNRKWDEYKEGFGSFKGKKDEFWLGNDHIHDLLSAEMTLQIDLMDWEGAHRYAIYENFRVQNEQNNYRLLLGMYSGNAGDALSGGSHVEEQWSASLNGMQFCTPDKDHDRYVTGNCAQENTCGWWFNRCHAANLNGVYHKKGNYSGAYDNGVTWSTWRGLWYSLKYTTMKIRPPSFLQAGSGNGMNT